MNEHELKNELLLDLIKNQKENSKGLKLVLIATIVSYTIILCSMVGGFFWYESQFEYETTTTTTTTTDITTEQEIEGDNAAINNFR